MHFTSVAELIPILQTAIGPMILISGVGLLLLTMTNRLARIVDRARYLAPQMATAQGADAKLLDQELCILWGRAKLVRLAIALVAASALAAAILIVVLFFTAIIRVQSAWLIAGLFVICMACVVGGLIAFLMDINRSLATLTLELKAAGFDRC
ncbi:MAG TPA: DUF2721 domain-containing protein [Anaerolineae bacterium]